MELTEAQKEKNRKLYEKRKAELAKEKSARKSGKLASEYNASFNGFVNITLTEEQKTAFGDWSPSAPWVEILSDLSDDGVVFSLKKDFKGDTYMASLTQRREDSENAGLCVTARSSDAGVAMLRILYIASQILPTAWREAEEERKEDRW